MRELTKSVTSLAWWSFMVSAKQMIYLVVPDNELAATLDAVAQAGDTMQRGVVDLIFTGFTLNVADPDMWAAR
jgi:hypothetical protein